jgi:ferredoxin-NADP reductase
MLPNVGCARNADLTRLETASERTADLAAHHRYRSQSGTTHGEHRRSRKADLRVFPRAGRARVGSSPPGHQYRRRTALGDRARWRVYLCGSPRMVGAARIECFLAGAASEEILADAFLAYEPTPTVCVPSEQSALAINSGHDQDRWNRPSGHTDPGPRGLPGLPTIPFWPATIPGWGLPRSLV